MRRSRRAVGGGALGGRPSRTGHRMRLEGSCHCGTCAFVPGVRAGAVPALLLLHLRKTAAAGQCGHSRLRGHAGGRGAEHLASTTQDHGHRRRLPGEFRAPALLHRCGSALWMFDRSGRPGAPMRRRSTPRALPPSACTCSSVEGARVQLPTGTATCSTACGGVLETGTAGMPATGLSTLPSAGRLRALVLPGRRRTFRIPTLPARCPAVGPRRTAGGQSAHWISAPARVTRAVRDLPHRVRRSRRCARRRSGRRRRAGRRRSCG